MLSDSEQSCLKSSAATLLNASSIDKEVKSVFDWKCILIGSSRGETPTFYMGMGRNKNFYFNKSAQNWLRVPETLKFDLPARTLIFAEAVQEGRGEGKGMRKCPALHVIDAVYVAGEDWRNRYDLKERNRLLRLFVKAMAKRSCADHVTMRVKDIVGLENLQDQCLSKLTLRALKGFPGMRLTIDVDEEVVENNQRIVPRYFMPTGLLLLPIVKQPFMMALSKSTGRKYWYNFMEKKSYYECPQLAMVDFKYMFEKRYFFAKIDFAKSDDIYISDYYGTGTKECNSILIKKVDETIKNYIGILFMIFANKSCRENKDERCKTTKLCLYI